MFFVQVKYWFTILILANTLLKSQNDNLYYNKLTTDNGLPSNTIYSIIQSKTGYLYIGHEFGISRYNGNSFYNYKYKGSGKSLHNLIETNFNIIASSFYGDLVKIKGDSISKHPYSEKEKSGNPIIKKVGKEIFILEKKKIFILKKDKLIQIRSLKENSSLWIYDISETKNHEFIIAASDSTNSKLIALDAKFNIKKTDVISSDNTKKMKFININDKLHVYLFGTNQLYEINKEGVKLSKSQFNYDFKSTKWINILTIDDHTIGICGYDGLLLFNTKGAKVKHLIKGSQVSDAIKDIEGNLIVGTLNEGIYIFPSQKILNYNLEDYLDKKELINKITLLNDSTLIIGTTQGKIIKYDLNSTNTQSIQIEKRAEIQSIIYDNIHKKIMVFCDALYILNEKNLKIENTLTVTSTKDILIHQNTIYCATSSQFIIIKNGQQTNAFDNTWINCLKYDTLANKIWLGTNKGLMYYDLKLNKGEKKTVDVLNQSNANIKTIKNHINGDLYLLVFNFGIIKKDIADKYSVALKNEDVENFDLKNDTLIAVFKNEVHFYDLNYRKLLYKLNETKGMDGLILDFIQTKKYSISVHSKFINLYRSYIKPNAIKPKLVISHLKGSFNNSSGQVLQSNYERNTISFKIEILPNISSKNNFVLKYKLLNVDEDWVKTTSNGSEIPFRYQQLKAGNYTFEAIALNEDNIESEKLTLCFEILPPFWQKWWFISIMFIIVATCLIMLYVWRVRFLNRKNLLKITTQRNKIRLLTAELTAIRSQMNPHFIFNILSSIQSKILNEKTSEAYNDISSFSKIIRSALDYSSKEFIKLTYELEFIKNYLQLESSRFEGKMQYELNVDKNIDTHFTEIPTLITLPFIENSIKHGLLHKDGDKTLKINFRGNNEKLEISIIDNGIGRERSALINKQSQKGHRSFATEAMRKRIEGINNSEKMKIDFDIIDHAIGVEVKINLYFV